MQLKSEKMYEFPENETHAFHSSARDALGQEFFFENWTDFLLFLHTYTYNTTDVTHTYILIRAKNLIKGRTNEQIDTKHFFQIHKK